MGSTFLFGSLFIFVVRLGLVWIIERWNILERFQKRSLKKYPNRPYRARVLLERIVWILSGILGFFFYFLLLVLLMLLGVGEIPDWLFF